MTLGTSRDDSPSLARALERNPNLRVQDVRAAARAAEIVFLATPFAANASIVPGLAGELEGKVLVDCTNPVGPGLRHGLASELSGSEALQALVPGARVVKAFSIYGFETLEGSPSPAHEVKPAMLYCGADEPAKRVVSTLIAELGWDPVDVGGLEQALHLEHMTLLWIRLVRVNGKSPNLVWAALGR